MRRMLLTSHTRPPSGINGRCGGEEGNITHVIIFDSGAESARQPQRSFNQRLYPRRKDSSDGQHSHLERLPRGKIY